MAVWTVPENMHFRGYLAILKVYLLWKPLLDVIDENDASSEGFSDTSK